jgi:hypothetical protein
MGTDFDHAKAETKNILTAEESRYIAGRCLKCSKDFKYKKALRRHEKQCIRTASKEEIEGSREWAKRSFEYAKAHASDTPEELRKNIDKAFKAVKKKRGAQPGNQHARKYAEKVLLTAKDQTSIYKMPAQRDIDSETVSNTGATPQAPQPPTDDRWSTDIRSFATNRLYDYLLAGILTMILLCGIIYAVVGIKLLFGW